jgi:hypothetical protein
MDFEALEGTYAGVGVDGAPKHDKLQEFRCTQCGWAMARTEHLEASPPEAAKERHS